MRHLSAGLCSLILALFPAQDTTEEGHPRVRPVAGQVVVWRASSDKIEDLKEAAAVPPSDRLGSRAGTPARLLIEPDLFVTLRGIKATATEGLAVARSGKKIVLKIYRGSVLVENVETELELETAHGRISGRGISVLVDVTKDAMRVVAIDGRLTFLNELGRVELSGGETSTASAGKAPSAPRPTVPEREAGWVKDLDAPANIITNGGFEQGTSAWRTYVYWNGKSVLNSDPQVARGGKKSARVDLPGVQFGPKTGGSSATLDQQQANVLSPGVKYFLRFWVRSQNLRVGDKDASVRVLVGSGLAQTYQGTFTGDAPPCEGEWRCGRFFFTAEHADLRLTFSVAVDADAPVDGTFWIDDVFLAPVPR
ncbi:MAG: carbohydrate binding domain-containing protein [Planctomycetes bacterium]|nr:carbohydrate binding domain-containing protein [Planctomycetota bacterium]